jgi:pimeloyl-ACP methyl ester carboxylesterase
VISVLRHGPDRLMRRALGRVLYQPSRKICETPADRRLPFDELEFQSRDGERIHAWWIAGQRPSHGHVLFCHGNAGNIGDRVLEAALLVAEGFDVLLFDYRGYGRSSGRPDELGTYRDARAARAALRRQSGVDRDRVFYLGESLGGAVALELAIEHPPRGLILQSTFTSIRDAARALEPRIPAALIPDAYPSLRRIGRLSAPLLVLHGDRDETIPLDQGQALFKAASEPKRIRVFKERGHNDLTERSGRKYAKEIADWAASLDS